MDPLRMTGFPSPAADYIEEQLNLYEFLIKNPPATFFMRTSGNSMQEAGIQSGDILIVDRSVKPADGTIVVINIDGEFIVRRLLFQKGKVVLVSGATDDEPIEISKDWECLVWGVVTFVIHRTG